MKMVTTEKILQTMNSWQSGEVIAVRRKKCLGASSRPSIHYLSTINILRKQVFFFDISKNVRGIYEILCAARYMSNELIFQISASWVIGKHPGGKFCEMQFLQCKMTQIGHFHGVIRRVSRGCLMVSIILTCQDMSIFRWSGEILKKISTGLA